MGVIADDAVTLSYGVGAIGAGSVYVDSVTVERVRAWCEGFSLHAGVVIAEHDRA